MCFLLIVCLGSCGKQNTVAASADLAEVKYIRLTNSAFFGTNVMDFCLNSNGLYTDMDLTEEAYYMTYFIRYLSDRKERLISYFRSDRTNVYRELPISFLVFYIEKEAIAKNEKYPIFGSFFDKTNISIFNGDLLQMYVLTNIKKSYPK